MLERVRERERLMRPHTRTWDVYNPSGVLTSSGSDGPHTVQQAYELLSDTWPRRFSERLFHPCWHAKDEIVFLKGPHTYYDSGWAVRYTGNSVSHEAVRAFDQGLGIPFCSHIFPGFDFIQTACGGSLSSFVDGAGNSWNQVPVAGSFANDLLELGDLKRLVTSFRDLLQSWRSVFYGGLNVLQTWWRNSNTPPGHHWEAPLAPVLRYAANRGRDAYAASVNGFLAQQFGLIPLTQSVKALAVAYYKIVDRLEFLRRTRGREVTLTYGRLYTWASSGRPATTPNTPFIGWTEREMRYKLLTGVRLLHELQGLDDLTAYLRAFGQYGGFNRILSIAWNAIPYSFVADWLSQTGDALDKLEYQAFEGRYRLREPWTSCKGTGYTHYWGWHYPHQGVNQPEKWSTTKHTRYVRAFGLPPVPPTTSGLSWLQLALIGALAFNVEVS